MRTWLYAELFACWRANERLPVLCSDCRGHGAYARVNHLIEAVVRGGWVKKRHVSNPGEPFGWLLTPFDGIPGKIKIVRVGSAVLNGTGSDALGPGQLPPRLTT